MLSPRSRSREPGRHGRGGRPGSRGSASRGRSGGGATCVATEGPKATSKFLCFCSAIGSLRLAVGAAARARPTRSARRRSAQTSASQSSGRGTSTTTRSGCSSVDLERTGAGFARVSMGTTTVCLPNDPLLAGPGRFFRRRRKGARTRSIYFTMKLYDKTSHRSRARLRQNVRGLDDDLRDDSDDPLRITPASAPTKRTIPYCSGHLVRSPGFTQARKMVSTTSSGLGASSTDLRDASVHLFYESSVQVHVVCPTSSISVNP